MSAVAEPFHLDRWAQVRADARAWEPPRVPTVVVAPHPDDETLLSGGLIVHQAMAGVPVTVVAVTDGEAAYPGDREELADRRRREQHEAVGSLTGGEVCVRRLGLPDGDVGAHQSLLVEAIAERLVGGSLLVAPWRMDHHCDHEAVGRAAHHAARRCDAVLAEGFFWTWHHRQPHELRHPVGELHLSAPELARRRRALGCYRSQFDGGGGATPVLHAGVLGSMAWRSEYFLVSGGEADPE